MSIEGKSYHTCVRAVFRMVFDYFVLDTFFIWIFFHCCVQCFVDMCYIEIMYCCLHFTWGYHGKLAVF